MCWDCDDPGGDDVAQVVWPTIRRCGWLVQGVNGSKDDAPLACTVGLTPRGLPELVVTGLGLERAATLLDEMSRRLVDGLPSTHGQAHELDGGSWRSSRCRTRRRTC
jgi:Domain of unknown function (DUF4262)